MTLDTPSILAWSLVGRALDLLVDRSERTGQPRLAEAARRILDDWRSKAAAG